MTDPTLKAAELAPPAARRRGLGFAVFILCVLFGMLAGLCAYRWIIVLPPERVQEILAAQKQLAQFDARLRALETRAPETVSAPTTPAPATDDTSRLQTEVGSLSAALASLQGEVKQGKDSTQGLVAAAVAFMRLDAAARSGRGFAAELTALRGATSRRPEWQAALTPLDAYAAAGAPGFANLQQQWAMLSPHIANAVAKGQAQNWRERIIAELKSLVSIRSLNDPAQGDVAAIDAALAQGDASAALTALAKLPQATQGLTESFRHSLEARRAVDETLTALASRLDADASGTSAP